MAVNQNRVNAMKAYLNTQQPATPPPASSSRVEQMKAYLAQKEQPAGTPPPPSADQLSAEQFKPSFAANTENPSIAEPLKAVGNVPSSTVQFAKGVGQFLNPARSVPEVVKSTAGIVTSVPGAVKDATYDPTYGNPDSKQAQKYKQDKGAWDAVIAAGAKDAAGKGTTATSLLNPVTAENPTMGKLIFNTLTGAGKGAYKAVTPQALQEINRGDTKAAQRTLTNDPVGQIAPLLLMADQASGGKGGTVDKAISKTGETVLKPVKAAIDAVPKPDIVTKTPAELRTDKIASGFGEQNTRLKSASKAFSENTKTYIEPNGAKTTVTPTDTFAKYKIAPEVSKGKIQMGDYKTGDGALGKIKTHVQNFESEINNRLKDTGKKVDVEEMKQQAIEKAKTNEELRRAGKVASTVKQIEARFEDYKASYGDQLDITEVNKIREVANKDWSPETQDVSRIVGDTTRDIVYNATDDKVVQQLLRQQGELLSAKKYAEAVNGTAVNNGRLGQMFLRQTGSIIGSTLDRLPVAGPVIGALGGDLLAKVLQQSQFKSFSAGAKEVLGNVAKAGQKVYQSAKNYNEHPRIGLGVEDVNGLKAEELGKKINELDKQYVRRPSVANRKALEAAKAEYYKLTRQR